MSGESRAFAQGPSVFFDGRTVQAQARDNNYDGFIEAEAVRARGNPMDVLLKAARELKTDDGHLDLASLSNLTQSVMAEAKLWRNCTVYEKRVFMATPYGEAATLWYCLRHGFDKDWTIDRVRYVMAESMRAALAMGGEAIQQWADWKDGLFAAIDQAGGEDILGNLTGLRPKVTAAAPAPVSSSGDSAKSTDTPPTKSDE